MNVLIACEFSGIVRDAFTELGHNAVSCDFLESEAPGLHYKGNVIDIINDGWDLCIAHPPCTYLCLAQAHLLSKDKERKEKSKEALQFILNIYNSKIPKVVIENPIGALTKLWRKPDQIIFPYQFGDPYRKDICLWIKGVRKLKIPEAKYWNKERKSVSNHTNGRMSNEERSKIKSRFFPKLAKAMANQWSLIDENYKPGSLQNIS